MKNRGVFALVPMLITFMVVVIITFYVVLPVMNSQLVNASTQPANLTGNMYTGAWTVASQLPLLTVVVLVVIAAAMIMFAIGRGDGA